MLEFSICLQIVTKVYEILVPTLLQAVENNGCNRWHKIFQNIIKLNSMASER